MRQRRRCGGGVAAARRLKQHLCCAFIPTLLPGASPLMSAGGCSAVMPPRTFNLLTSLAFAPPHASPSVTERICQCPPRSGCGTSLPFATALVVVEQAEREGGAYNC